MQSFSAVVFSPCFLLSCQTLRLTRSTKDTVQPQNRSVISGGGGIQITGGGFVPGVREVMEHRGVVFGPPLLWRPAAPWGPSGRDPKFIFPKYVALFLWLGEYFLHNSLKDISPNCVFSLRLGLRYFNFLNNNIHTFVTTTNNICNKNKRVEQYKTYTLRRLKTII